MSHRLTAAIMNIAFKLLGARRVLRQKHIKQLELTGLTSDQILPVLNTIHSVGEWQKRWTEEADKSLVRANTLSSDDKQYADLHKTASAMYYMAGILHRPDHPDLDVLIEKLVASYQTWGQAGAHIEKLIVPCDATRLHCNLYYPSLENSRATIIMIPPLGCVKEQIDFQVAPFQEAGHTCVTVDLPGVGETQGAMRLDSQLILSQLISHLETRRDIPSNKIIMMGMSLGAYWSMKTAAIDPRVNLGIGISTPAISGKHWNRLPKHYWQHFQKVFKTPDLRTTRQITEQLSLFGVMDKIKCPVLLFHGQKDVITQPDTMRLFHLETKHAPLTTRVYEHAGHCCLENLKYDILPIALNWLDAHI